MSDLQGKTQIDSSPSIWKLGVCALVIVLGTFSYLQYKAYERSNALGSDLENVATKFSGGGTYDVQLLKGALRDLSPDDANYVKAHIIFSAARFLDGSRNDRIEAIKMVKDRYTYAREHNLAASQALAINQLVQYTITAYDILVTEEVFRGEFASLYDASDISASLARLSNVGIQAYPTSDAYLNRANQQASVLMNDFLGAYALSAEEIVATSDVVKAEIARADALFARDAGSPEYQAFGTDFLVLFYSMRGRLYGMLSLYDKANVENMKTSYEMAIAASNGVDAQRLVNGMLPYVYLNRALFTFYADSTQKTIIHNNLVSLTALIEADPAGTRLFVQYLRSVARLPQIGGLLTLNTARELAKEEPSFKTLLQNAEWNL